MDDLSIRVLMTAIISDLRRGRAEKWKITPRLDLVWCYMKKHRVQGQGAVFMCGEGFEVTRPDGMEQTGKQKSIFNNTADT